MHHNFLFDLDQTLLDFHASERKALEIVLTDCGLNYTDGCYEHFKEYNKLLWLELEKGNISRTELFTKRFSDIIEYCRGDLTNIDVLQLNNDFILTMSRNGVLMDGALEFMRRITSDIPDARCYIISNGATVNAEGRIKTTGLDKYLTKIYVSEWMGVNKPSSDFFDIVLDGVAEPKDACIVIGDSLTSDMLGARNAGLTSVWFMPSGDIPSACLKYDINYCASSFNELYDVLLKWAHKGKCN